MTNDIIKDYTDLALKTELKDYLIKLKPIQFRKLHATIGISTEIGELVNSKDGINTAEEIGDIFYYIAILCKILDLSFENLLTKKEEINYNKTDILSCVVIAASELLDSTKKEIFYKKYTSNKDFTEKLHLLVEYLFIFIDLKGLKIENILLKNINKLKLRYGEKFSINNAINRDLEAELKILREE